MIIKCKIDKVIFDYFLQHSNSWERVDKSNIYIFFLFPNLLQNALF